MGWEQYVRRPQGAGRRPERTGPRRVRGTEGELGWSTLDGTAEAAYRWQRYETYLVQLVSLHLECGDRWDWQRVSMSPPTPPVFQPQAELAARAALEAFRPGVADQLAGRATRRCARLVDRVEHAIDVDRQRYRAALAQHRIAYWRWITASELAAGVLGLDERVCREALRFVD